MTAVRAIAPAKLNLTLEVLGRREDGYHDLESVVIHLDLADELQLTPSATREISYRDDGGRRVAILSDDIVDRTWDRLIELDGERGWKRVPAGGRLEVRKRIPIAAGLGGGSADAAAFLRLARLAWELPIDDAALSAFAATIGSDVPACLTGGPLRMSGRGEIVEPLEVTSAALTGWAVLLATPEIPVPADKTATMYRSLRPTHFGGGAATAALAALLSEGERPSQEDCVNSFDAVANEVLQGLEPARRAFGVALARHSIRHGFEPIAPLLTGAGPSLFALLTPELAQAVAADLRPDWRGALHVARPLSRGAAIQTSS